MKTANGKWHMSVVTGVLLVVVGLLAASAMLGIKTEAQATNTPTSAPTAIGTAWITEVLPVATSDWNLRHGVGANDAFVEVYAPTPVSLAGWRIEVRAATPTP